MLMTRCHQSLRLNVVHCRIANLLCGLILFGLSISGWCQQVVIYPRPESSADERADYPLALLRLCESRPGAQFTLQASRFHAQQGRNLKQLAKGQGLDILWTLTSNEREQELLPIRIPIDRGLIGWRLLLIRDRDAASFVGIKHREDLAVLRAGQGHDWPDVPVLRENHLRVSTSTTYSGLFQMLALGHIQYFPRSVTEIWPELQRHKNLSLMIENNLVIHYPAALYFFVNKANVRLAKTIEDCLVEATQDKSLRTLFNSYFSEILKRAQLSKRRIIHLSNPTLPSATPIAKSEYWYSPTEGD